MHDMIIIIIFMVIVIIIAGHWDEDEDEDGDERRKMKRLILLKIYHRYRGCDKPGIEQMDRFTTLRLTALQVTTSLVP